jgi:hypothetical protein
VREHYQPQREPQNDTGPSIICLKEGFHKAPPW